MYAQFAVQKIIRGGNAELEQKYIEKREKMKRNVIFNLSDWKLREEVEGCYADLSSSILVHAYFFSVVQQKFKHCLGLIKPAKHSTLCCAM